MGEAHNSFVPNRGQMATTGVANPEPEDYFQHEAHSTAHSPVFSADETPNVTCQNI